MKISSSNTILTFSSKHFPVARCHSGQTVTFECLDCFSNTITSIEDTLSSLDMSQVNPATGPLYIEDAMIGDTLCVTIQEIKLAAQGVVVASPGFGKIGHLIDQEQNVLANIVGNYVDFEGHLIPLRKMVGVIGTAPRDQEEITGSPGEHGGNLDTIQITEGSKIFLPVNVEGALLALGDCHATMGDGEIIGSGLEVSADVTVTVDVLKNFSLPLPLIESPSHWITLASDISMDQASVLAIEKMHQLVQQISDLDSNEAAMILSLCGDLRVSQCVNPKSTMRMELAKEVLK